MKKIILASILLSCYFGISQVRMTGTNNSSVNSSAFIDASSQNTNNLTVGTGKGLVFPRVDLSTFTFVSGTTGISNNFPTRYDGMIVYNTKNGGLASTGTTQGTLAPGFWFYENKSNTLTGGTWKQLAAGKSILSGSINPVAATGSDGDFYINTDTNTIFGPKVAGAWPTTGTSLVGPAGATGAQGPIGLTGPAGAQGATGATGPTGLTGAAGPQGPQGIAGTNGTAVLNGSSNPSSATGVNGDFYINTATNTIFGPKAAGTWPATGTSLVGPAGAAGVGGVTTAGTNVTITGAGTTASPYVVNSAIETATQTPSTAIAASGTQVAVASTNVQGAIADLATAVKTAGNNLYTADGTLAGNRTVSQGANNLTFTGTGNTILNSGKVGIGTAAPTRALSIYSNGTSFEQLNIINDGTANNANSNAGLTITSNNRNSVLNLNSGDLNGSSIIFGDSQSSNGVIRYQNSDEKLVFGNGPGLPIAMTIDKDRAVGIGNTSPNASALLEVASTTRGFLPPRMTNAEMKAIQNPVNGLMVYNTTLNCMAYYVNGSYNCTHNPPVAPTPAAALGVTNTAHFNGITAEVSAGHTLATYTTGETFDQNATCSAKEISAQGCGGLTQVTGASGTVYPLIDINGQCWFQTNLKEIPSNFASYTPTSWLATSPGDQGYWGYYNTVTNGTAGWGISEIAANEGLLYQWSAAMDNSETERSRGLCPAGFHIPSDCEWMYLEHGQGMSLSQQIVTAWRANGNDNQGTPGYKLRSQGTNQTNTSGFSSLIAGYRSTNGSFTDHGSDGYFWSSTAPNTSTAFYRQLGSGFRGVFRANLSKARSFSVRCLKN